MSVDATDCPIYEPWPFDTKWYCRKSNGPGIKHEVGVAITIGVEVDCGYKGDSKFKTPSIGFT
eukprot:6023413-Ditylum_brightwellii.AAC.1